MSKLLIEKIVTNQVKLRRSDLSITLLFINFKIKKMETKDKISRLSVTDEAMEVIWELEKKHGALMFYQAGGYCEGTQPQCFEKDGYFPRMNDAMIGTINL